MHDHLPIGAGALNVAAILQTLADVNFAGPIVLEMNRAEDLTLSLERLAEYLVNK